MKLFFSVSFFCYCLAARFVDHINIRKFRGKNSSIDILSIVLHVNVNLRIWSSDSKENARFVAAIVKNRDLSRRMGKIVITHIPRFPFVLVLECSRMSTSEFPCVHIIVSVSISCKYKHPRTQKICNLESQLLRLLKI